MLASRWHSPPKPLSVLSCTTGMCRTDRRSASKLPATSPSSTPTRRPSSASPSSARSSSVVLPAPGALMRLTTVTCSRSKSLRLAPGDRVVGVEGVLDDPHLGAVHAAFSSSSTSIDSTMNSSPVATSTAPGPQVAQMNAGISISHSFLHVVAAQHGGHVDDLQGSALADRVLADDREVELERLLDDLAQPADAQRDVRDLAPGGVLVDGLDDRAGEIELVHRAGYFFSSSEAYASSVRELLGRSRARARPRGRRPPRRPGSGRRPSPRPSAARRRR